MVKRLYCGEEWRLRQAIAQAPDDDVPRLILADWLEEHGRTAEAEFIRVQLTIAQLEELSRAEQQQHVAIYRRQDDLLGHQEQLLRDVPEGLRSQARFDFHRGLLEQLTAPLQPLLAAVASLRHLLPLPRLCVEDTVANVRRVIGCRLLSDRPTPSATTGTPASSSSLSFPAGDTTATVGATTDHASLRDLAGLLTAIRTEIGKEWMPLRSGRSLAMSLWHRGDGDLPADQGEWVLAPEAVPDFPRLEILDLSGAALGEQNMQHLLAAAARFPRLHSLDVSANELGDETVAALLQTPWPRQLRRLILGGNLLTDHAARLLAEQWPADAPLQDLNLRFTAIGHEGRRLLIHRFGGRVSLF
ncbi:MAG: TIGR02996 domain-containing protein [Gemmataceae bacterium]|nr:TIGR02996 domain-containing protein [Gemmataceae bacterium]MCS7271095.1 TIGR02996 domain-containing protein [Gemmataceae bacterium]MDW8242620.1 TIGR02996 domain-containing protein [Thermogemmata sp.]